MRRLALFAALPHLATAATLRLPSGVVPPHSEREVFQYLETRVGRADQLLAGDRLRIRGESGYGVTP